jgi:hypothetical protein
MSLLVEFLNHVLPVEGWHAAFVLETKKHFWSRGIEPLAEFIARSDADGLTVYHACASFKEKSRKAEHALCARSLWCDVDAGPGKPYATPQEAAVATYEFCDRVGLPVPTLVGSGSGLHVYWPLVQTLDPDVWRRYGKALRNLSKSSGFHADPVRTADIASILRTPGTTNRKRDPAVLVEVGPLTGPYKIGDFKELENVDVRDSRVPSKPPSQRIAGGLSDIYETHPRHLQSISESCGQIRNFRGTLGKMPEPLWHACLGVAAFCEDGKALGHEWSKGDDRYNEAQTEEKLSRQGKFGPTTCERFHALEPKICEACPHFGQIKSPIVLSRTTEPLGAGKPRLLIEDCNPDRTVAALRDVLAGVGALYDRGVPVRLAFDQMQGGMVAQVISPDALVLMAHDVCRPYVIKTKNDHTLSETNARLPRQFAVMYLDWRGEWRLPPLNGIATAPLLREDGTIKSGEGYDSNSGMWCERVPNLTGLVAEHPNKDQAQAALRTIRETFKTFCFADAVTADIGTGVPVVNTSLSPGKDESAFLVALLTAVCRPSLHLAPGVLLRAAPMSGAGAGKGLLARCICIVAFGREPHAVTAGGTSEELEKRIAAELMEGSSALFLDNLNNTAFKSDLLASAITERPAKVRVLGKSQMVLLNASALVILTGNGLTVSEDLARRFITIDFDPRTENPEAREFKTDIRAEVRDRRRELLAALLTIWRWGRTTADIQSGLALGSFEQWCRWVRDPLLALGCQDPVARVSEAKERDGRRRRPPIFSRSGGSGTATNQSQYANSTMR